MPLMWPAPRECRLSFSMADVSKTFRHVNPRKAAGTDGMPSRVLRECIDQLAGVLKDLGDLFQETRRMSQVTTSQEGRLNVNIF